MTATEAHGPNPWMFSFHTMLDGELMVRWANFESRATDRQQWQGVECMYFDAGKAACRTEMLRRGFKL